MTVPDINKPRLRCSQNGVSSLILSFALSWWAWKRVSKIGIHNFVKCMGENMLSKNRSSAEEFKSESMSVCAYVVSHKEFFHVVHKHLEALLFHWVGRKVNLNLWEHLHTHTYKTALTDTHCWNPKCRVPLLNLPVLCEPLLMHLSCFNAASIYFR